MGYLKEKNGSTAYSESPISPGEPLSAVSGTSYASLANFEKKDLVLKKRIRFFRFVSRFLSVILNAGMMGILSYTLAKYYLTKDNIISGNGGHPWITPANLWPTFVLLGISTVTFVMNFITLCAYTCGVNAANKASTFTSVVVYGMTGLHVVMWAIAIGAYKMGNTPDSLWGFSCNVTDALQKEVDSYLNYGKLCTMQTGAWGLSILEGIAYLVTFVVLVMAMLRSSTKKKMARARESLSMDGGYNQQAYGQESGTVYSPPTGKRYMPVSVESSHV